MKALFVIQLVCLVSFANANNYYFSTVSGNDSRTSSQAQDPSTPWKTLSKLNAVFSTLQPGDALLLKRGETFFGSITIKKSGTASSPIVIGAYGSGNNPVITSLVTLSGWVSKGSGIWESSTTLGSTVNMVLFNGANQQMGRWPNSDASNKGYLIYESHSGKTSITDKQFGSSTNWAGAELVLRPRRWILDRNKIKSNTSTSISYTPFSSYEPYNNYGYFIQNSIKTLDKLGEWYYNASSKKLSMYFGSAKPTSYSIQSPTIDKLISSSGYSNIKIEDIAVKGAHVGALDFKSGANITITDCQISFSGVDGVVVNGTSKFIIQNSTVANSNNNGIDLGYNSDNAIVKNNTISNTSVIAGLGQSGDGTGLAIRSGGDDVNIEGNQILNTGYIAIFFNGNNLSIKNNLIDRFCFNKDDGAAIYSHKGASVYKNRKATYNIIMNGIGAGPGTDRPNYFPASGFYMDNNASAAEISNNTVLNCSHYGVYIHNSFGSIINNNTFFNNNFTQVSFIQDADNVTIRNTTVNNNIFFSKLPTQYLTYFRSHANDISSFGTWNNNYYARPLDDRIAIYCQYNGGSVKQNLDMEGWKSSYNEDASSKRTAKQVMPYKVNKLVGSNKTSGGSLSSASSSSVNVGSITKGKHYVLSFGLRGSSNSNRYLGAFLSNNTGEIQYRKISTTRNQYEMLFTSLTSVSSAKVSFKVDASSTYYLDNIKFYEADAKITNPDDSIKCVYNASTSTKSFAINGNFIDVKGNRYSNSVSLQPFTSVVLLKTGGGSSENLSPTIDITSPGDNVNFNALSDITITASADDDDGSVSKVSFYNGNNLLGSDNTSPYSYTWNNVASGEYTLTAEATDNDGSVTTSSEISVSVGTSGGEGPSVGITSPANNSNFTPLSDITITASADDDDGSVSKVEFYNGNTLLGTDNSSPYSFTWNNVPAGNYTLTAEATDNSGLSATSSSVSISVGTSTGGAPSVNITSPVNNSTFAPLASITLSALAADADGSISKVEFFNGANSVEIQYTAPYDFVWDNVAAGNYTITAKATDNSGLVTTSPPVSFTVGTSNGSPTVTITSPANNSTFAAQSNITLSALALDPNGSVHKVEFYNGATLLENEYFEPFEFIWTNVAPGNYTITAKATDNEGNVTTSSPVEISVAAQQAARGVSPSPDNEIVSLNRKSNPPHSDKSTSISKLDNFQLFPNPAVNKIQLSFNGLQLNQKAILTVRNAAGTILKRYPVTITGKKIDTDISTLGSGVYILSLSGDNFIINKKFIKVR